MEKAKIKNLFDLDKTIAKDLFEGKDYPWEVLSHIKEYVIEMGKSLPSDKYEEVKENVWIAKSAKVFESAYIDGPCIIDENAEVRHSAFIRGSAIVGKNAVVGNSTELKNAILFDNVQVPHFNYVGDSILGFKSHMGAGAVTSNVKSDKTLVEVNEKKEDGSIEKIETGLKKFGAMLGDFVEVGCNSVLCPGTVIGRNTNIYPTSMVRGVINSNAIFKTKDNIVEKK